MDSGIWIVIGAALVVVLFLALVLMDQRRREQEIEEEREELRGILAGMVKESPPARRLPPLRPPTPSTGTSPKEEVRYLKEAIERRERGHNPAPAEFKLPKNPPPAPPKPGRRA